ncbi:MAG TPA: PAS domain S-box protein [Terriglobales bacterium]|nr:PAS domain S-box protein [Terriglobales bacterium]
MSTSRNYAAAVNPKPDGFEHSSHVVQFYEDDSQFLEKLSRFIGSALGAGDAAVVIATPAHRDGLAQRLHARGLDMTFAVQQGRFISLDAAETLTRLLVNDWPDAKRFAEIVGGVIEQAQATEQGKQQRVVAFGEMVALLWAEGKHDAALHLEQLWNDLAKTHSFTLCCGYPMAGFSEESHTELIQKVCAEHSHVIPAESYASLLNEEERFLNIVCLQQKAQALQREMAERKKAQHALQLREAELVDFLEHAVIAMHWVAADGTILWANKAEMELLGYSREEYVGHHIREFHADEPVIEDILRRLGRNEELHGYEARLRHKDGSLRRVRIHSSVFMQEGKFVHTRCFTIDVTDQKNADEARMRLAAIVESSDDAIVSKDLNGIVTSWNRSAERIFGYKAGEIIGKPITTIIPPELHQDEPMILGKIRRGERIEHFETVRVKKNGERIHVSLTISPVKNDRGNVIGAAKIVRDITENKKIEETLRLNERLASVGRLAATIAHEINNPLEAVTNLLYLAKRDVADSSRVRRHLEMADHELTRVAHITRQTLGFYRDNASPASVDISQVLDDLLFLYGKRLSARGIEIVKQYEGKIEVSALAGEIRQVFSNLIANAIDAMPDGGSLIVRASNSHEWNNSDLPGARVIIADTGSGIDPENRKKLFQPFFTTKKEVGTGLGLWITSGIVEKHGGSIRVRSRTEAGRSGTAFALFLPATPPRQEEEGASTLRSHAPDFVNSERTSVA